MAIVVISRDEHYLAHAGKPKSEWSQEALARAEARKKKFDYEGQSKVLQGSSEGRLAARYKQKALPRNDFDDGSVTGQKKSGAEASEDVEDKMEKRKKRMQQFKERAAVNAERGRKSLKKILGDD